MGDWWDPRTYLPGGDNDVVGFVKNKLDNASAYFMAQQSRDTPAAYIAENLSSNSSKYGGAIPVLYGKRKIGSNIIYFSDFVSGTGWHYIGVICHGVGSNSNFSKSTRPPIITLTTSYADSNTFTQGNFFRADPRTLAADIDGKENSKFSTTITITDPDPSVEANKGKLKYHDVVYKAANYSTTDQYMPTYTYVVDSTVLQTQDISHDFVSSDQPDYIIFDILTNSLYGLGLNPDTLNSQKSGGVLSGQAYTFSKTYTSSGSFDTSEALYIGNGVIYTHGGYFVKNGGGFVFLLSDKYKLIDNYVSILYNGLSWGYYNHYNGGIIIPALVEDMFSEVVSSHISEYYVKSVQYLGGSNVWLQIYEVPSPTTDTTIIQGVDLSTIRVTSNTIREIFYETWSFNYHDLYGGERTIKLVACSQRDGSTHIITFDSSNEIRLFKSDAPSDTSSFTAVSSSSGSGGQKFAVSTGVNSYIFFNGYVLRLTDYGGAVLSYTGVPFSAPNITHTSIIGDDSNIYTKELNSTTSSARIIKWTPNFTNYTMNGEAVTEYSYAGSPAVSAIIKYTFKGLPNTDLQTRSSTDPYYISLNPYYGSSTTASSAIKEILDLVDCWGYYSDNTFKIVSKKATAAVFDANDQTLLVSGQPVIVSITEDDLLELTQITINAPSDISGSTESYYNTVQIQYTNASSNYDSAILQSENSKEVLERGESPSQVINASNHITNTAVAQEVVNRKLERAGKVWRQITIVLPHIYCYLEPTDIITLTDTQIGLNATPLRVVSTDEDEEGRITLVLEDIVGSIDATQATIMDR